MGQPFMQKYKEIIDEHLHHVLPREDAYPDVIHQAMAYSLFAGGKRFRPILCLCACETVGGDIHNALEAACAMEMVHTYSLIHDDLPGMDDDDYRRGKLTNHKVFGEAMAILAGDGLLTHAFAVLANANLTAGGAQKAILAIHELAQAAGTLGMIGGQVVDILSEKKQPTLELLEYIHHHKTAALIIASVKMGGIYGEATTEQMAQLETYGKNLGLAYQITDDILDVIGDEKKIGKPVGSDAKNNKATFPLLYGLAASEAMAQQAVDQAIQALEGLPGDISKLSHMAAMLIRREA